jgi:hypothetical protein
MDTLHPHCAGLDVHKDSVMACVRHAAQGGKAIEHVRSFGTMTSDLLALGDCIRCKSFGVMMSHDRVRVSGGVPCDNARKEP